MLDEFGSSLGFLQNLDKKGIMRYVSWAVSRSIVPQFIQEQKRDCEASRNEQARQEGDDS